MLKVLCIRMNAFSRQILVATLSNLFGRGVGFFVPIVLAYIFGVSDETDAFFLAYGIVTFCSTVLSQPATHLIVPFIGEIDKNSSGKQELGRFLASLILSSGIILLGVSGLIYMTINYWLASMLPLQAKGQLIFIRSLGLFLGALPVFTWNCLLTGTLYARQRFGFSSLSPAIRGTTVLASLFLLKDYFGIVSAAVGFLLGEILRFLILCYFVSNLMKIVVYPFNAFDTVIKNFYKKSSFQLWAMVFTVAIPLLARAFALTIGPGALTVYEYAEKLYIIPLNFISFGLFTVLLTNWSKLYLNKGPRALDIALGKAALAVAILSAVISIMFFFASPYIIDLIFTGSNLTSNHLSSIKDTFGIMILGLVPNLTSQVFSRGLLVRRNTRYIFFASVVTLVTVLLSLTYVVSAHGVSGVAIALVLGYTVSLISMSLMYIREKRKGTKDAYFHKQHVWRSQ